MYIDEQLVVNKAYYREDCFLKKNPNPLTKKYKEIFKCNGEYLNTDNDARGMYLVAEKYNLLDEDRSYKHFFKKYYGTSDYCNQLLGRLESFTQVPHFIAQSKLSTLDNLEQEFPNVKMSVQEFAKFRPKGNFLLIAKPVIKNRCKFWIPVFDGQFLNNINCHKWAVVDAYQLPDLPKKEEKLAS